MKQAIQELTLPIIQCSNDQVSKINKNHHEASISSNVGIDVPDKKALMSVRASLGL